MFRCSTGVIIKFYNIEVKQRGTRKCVMYINLNDIIVKFRIYWLEKLCATMYKAQCQAL